ncbi:MAG TPA: VOC family protein [Gaiellaceae bacterium]|nr:VOC family protein [Gaiellaceae bacterium]
MHHLALAVTDQERSRRFYETYLGFDAEPARRYDDGVLMLYDATGFALALGPVEQELELPPFLHFGKGVGTPDEVRAFAERLAADGVPVLERWEEPDYVSVKFRDPDGYVVEVSWEPD